MPYICTENIYYMTQIYRKRGRKGNYIVPEREKMTFRGQYFSLPDKAPETPKEKFIREIMETCLVSKSTVRCWIAGEYRPDSLKRNLISKKLGIEPEILFPNEAV